jgi:hypothetical protein
MKLPSRSARPSRTRGAVPREPVGGRAPRAKPAARPRHGTAAHARRRGRPSIRVRPPRLLAPGRLLAIILAVLSTAGLVLAVNGPWLRVTSIAFAGTYYTSRSDLEWVLRPVQGMSLLLVDSGSVASRIEQLPSVAGVTVVARLPHTLDITITEKTPAFVWQTDAVRLIGASDGSLIGEIALNAQLPAALARLPFVDDRRSSSHNRAEGDEVPADELATALALDHVQVAALGGASSGLHVQVDELCGFSLVSNKPAWQAIFGYDALVAATPGQLSARITEQVASVRTLFAGHPAAGVAWVDVRNPGKVYWRPNGSGGSGPC